MERGRTSPLLLPSALVALGLVFLPFSGAELQILKSEPWKTIIIMAEGGVIYLPAALGGSPGPEGTSRLFCSGVCEAWLHWGCRREQEGHPYVCPRGHTNEFTI